MPAIEVRAIVQQELLGGEPLESIFRSFDDKPLGSASIAQVHAATLLDGRRVAVKVQRPNCEQKLLADIANLKSFSKKLASALPVDYYTVCISPLNSSASALPTLERASNLAFHNAQGVL